jgi:hypothetical protein
MTYEEFEKVVDSRFELCKRTLGMKNAEYARAGDKLNNFKKAAALQGCHPATACQGMMAKHQVSIVDLVKDLEAGKRHPKSMWDEKLGDALNYLLLLDAIVQEDDNNGRCPE